MRHLKKRLLLETFAILFTFCSVYSQTDCETQISFDTQPLNTFGASNGDNVGDIIFSESDIDVRIDSMLWFNGSRGYNYVEIQNVDCGFGLNQRAWFNNASLVFDLNSISTLGVSFIYWDNGGEENLQVNGSTEHVITSFKSLPTLVAPDVYCVVDSMYKDNCSGNEIGRVTLLGNINELKIAGQELAIDSLCIDEVPHIEIPEDFECETQVSFDTQPTNTYGASEGDNVGDIIFTESDIDVRIDSMLWFNGSRGYNYIQIQDVDCGFGLDQRAWFNNASLIFDLNSITTIGVSFIYWDNGGEENLQVNGDTEYVISSFKDLPALVAPDVFCVVDSVTKDECYGIEIGRVTLLGNINELRIAGQELAIDSLCIDEFPHVEIPEDFECETQVSFDTEPTNTYGASEGDNVGDIIFTESDIDVRIDSMLWFNGSKGYNYVQIQDVDCGFGLDQRAWFNNASLIFDLNSIPTIGVSFIYWDNGGEENLQVNGDTEYVISSFKDLPLLVAPDVFCVVDSVYKDNCSGNEIGRVTLLGNINELRIAGQELAIDSLCIDEFPPIEIPEDFECETQVSFDTEPLNTYGASYGNNAGDVIFNESDIDVRIDSMLWFNGSRGYNFVEVQNADCGFGFDQRAWFNNASLIFDMHSISTVGVSFIYWDHGGNENLQVNGDTEHVIANFKDLPPLVAPNVLCVVDSVYKDECYGVEVGRVTLLGNINELRIAGQELAIDSLCIDEFPPVDIPDDFECETQINFDTQPLNTFGSGHGNSAGDLIFDESGIDVSINDMLWFNGSRGYNSVEIQNADCGFGFDKRAWFNNASLVFDLNSINTIGVSFIYWDQGGEENLQVNGDIEHVISSFKALPVIVAPDVYCVVDSVTKDECYGIEIGRVTLLGNINELRIAGQELAIDSLCIDEFPPTAVEEIQSKKRYYLSQNRPNPFSLSTEISYYIPEPGFAILKIYDIHGKEVKVLVNEYQPKGKYKLNFNKEYLPTGMYFYKLQVNNFVKVQKMLLIK